MDFLGGIDSGSLIWVVGIGCVCCLLIIVLGFGLQFIGTALGLVGNVFEVIFGLFGAGPLPGCGCIVVGGGCGLVLLLGYLFISAAASCGTNPTNFCTLIGR